MKFGVSGIDKLVPASTLVKAATLATLEWRVNRPGGQDWVRAQYALLLLGALYVSRPGTGRDFYLIRSISTLSSSCDLAVKKRPRRLTLTRMHSFSRIEFSRVVYERKMISYNRIFDGQFSLGFVTRRFVWFCNSPPSAGTRSVMLF